MDEPNGKIVEVEVKQLSSTQIWLQEARRLLVLAVPLMVQNLLATALSIMTIAFVGHLNDPLMLSSVVMGTSLFNITGLYIITGFSAGLDTLIGQAYGARQFKLVGITLQRALCICLLLCLPITAAWTRLRDVLLFLQQPLPIVEGACQFLSHTAPSLYMLAVGQCLARYLTAQQMVGAPLMAAMAEVITAPVAYWVLIHKMDLGLAGAAYAFNLSNLIFALSLTGYTVLHEIMMKGTPEQTWFGWSLDMFKGWRQYLKLALPACAMVCAEMWMFEVVILEAGLLDDAEIAQGVMGMMQQICTFLYMLPYGMGSAANVRIANELGSGRAQTAKLIFQVALSMQMCIQLAIGGATYLFNSQVAEVFTGSTAVLQLAEKVIPLVALNVVGDGLTTTQTGVLRGCGRQEIGAICNLLSYWVVGVPLTYLMGIYYNLGVIGFWLALAITMNLQGIVLLCVLLSLSWEHEVERAKALIMGHAMAEHGFMHTFPGDETNGGVTQPLLAGFEHIHASPYGPLTEWNVEAMATPHSTPRNSGTFGNNAGSCPTSRMYLFPIHSEEVTQENQTANQAIDIPGSLAIHVEEPLPTSSMDGADPTPTLASSLPIRSTLHTPRTPTLPLMVPRARGIRQSLVYEVSDLVRSGSNAALASMGEDDGPVGSYNAQSRMFTRQWSTQDMARTL